MKGHLTFIPAFAVFSFSVSCTSTVQKASANANWGSPAEAEKKRRSLSKRSGSRDDSKRRTVRTTAYSHMENEPGAPGKKNAVGTNLRYGQIRSAAADWSRYPLGTQFRIVGHPHLYEIDDFGSALVGTGTIDIYKPTLRLMREWGVRHVDIQIVKWGSFEKSASILSKRCHHAHCLCMYQSLQKRQGLNPDRFGFLCRKP